MPITILQNDYDGSILIIIQSFAKTVREQLISEMQLLRLEMKAIADRVSALPEKEEIELLRRNSLPLTKQAISTFNRSTIETELDIAILFSEPIYE